MMLLALIVLGLVLGSFVNAFVWRLHEGKDWVRGRSECTHCRHPLAPKDLVPVVSYLILRGKCRYCRRAIADTPFAELILPAWFALSYICWPGGVGHTLTASLPLAVWLAASVLLVALMVYDKRWFLLPDKVVFPLTGLAAGYVAAQAWQFEGNVLTGLVLPSLGAALSISGLFYLLFQVSKGKWIGGGDVKLGLALGLFAGSPVKAMLLLFFASVLGSLSMVPLLVQGKARRNMHLPFGPFLILGLLITVLFGQHILDWYDNLLYV